MMEQQERADRTRRQNMSACMRTAREFMRVTREGVKIMVVLISLVIIFKEQLTNLVRSILSKITKQSNSI